MSIELAPDNNGPVDAKTKTVTIRMPADLHAFLTAQMATSFRTMTKEIVHRLRESQWRQEGVPRG